MHSIVPYILGIHISPRGKGHYPLFAFCASLHACLDGEVVNEWVTHIKNYIFNFVNSLYIIFDNYNLKS